jgi:hypothetical protein
MADAKGAAVCEAAKKLKSRFQLWWRKAGKKWI